MAAVPPSLSHSPTATLHDEAPHSPASNTKKEADLERAVRWEGEGTDASPYVVKFHPGEGPMGFSEIKKWTIVASVAMGTLCVAFGSSVYAGGFGAMLEYFQVSEEIITLGLSLYVLGFVFGPLIWAPVGEAFGRRIVFQYTYFGFFIFQLGCGAARNIETLLVCRFFAGFFGAAPLTNAGGAISDTFSASERGLAVAAFALAPFMGPVLGPIVGGYIGQSVTWRWIFWNMSIFAGVMYIIQWLCVPETYAPVLLRRLAAELTLETGRVHVSQFDLSVGANQSFTDKLKVNLSRPFVLLFRELIVMLFSIYAAIVYGTLYLMFGAFPIVFQIERGWTPGQGGLAFIGVGVGMTLGVALNIWENGRYSVKLENAGGRLPPEARLPMCALGGVLIPIGLFAFAWTSTSSVHWIAPIISTVPFGMGMLLVFLSLTNYLIDSYLMFAASVLAANAVLRSIFGAIFPLFTAQMFQKLGTNWALTLVSFLSLICTPIPFLFIHFGPKIRSKSTFAPGHPIKILSKNSTRKERELVVTLREEDLDAEENVQVEIERERMKGRKGQV